jgi:hypothetical protein
MDRVWHVLADAVVEEASIVVCLLVLPELAVLGGLLTRCSLNWSAIQIVDAVARRHLPARRAGGL